MIQKWVLGFISLMFLMQPAIGQGVVQIEKRVYNSKWEDQTSVVLYYYRFTSNTLDLTHFQTVVPELREVIPAHIRVNLPEGFSSREDLVYAVGYLGNASEGQLLTLLVADYGSDEPEFFPDINLNYDFSDDGPSFRFEKHTRYRDFSFRLPDEKREPFLFRLWHPQFQEEINDKALKKEKLSVPKTVAPTPAKDLELSENVEKARKEGSPFVIRASVQMGFGFIKYVYVSKESGFPVSYQGSLTSKGIELTANYNRGPVHIGLTTGIENAYYWTSITRVQNGEPYTYMSYYVDFRGDTTWTEHYVSNITEKTNADVMPENRVYLGINLEYSIRISRLTHLNPYGRLYFSKYLNDGFVADRFERDPKTFYFGTAVSGEGGILFDFAVSPYGSLVASLGMHFPSFNPKGFFDEVAQGDVSKSFIAPRFGLGYQVRLR